MIDYLLSFQVFASIYVIIAIGYGCSGIKLFNSSDAEAIRKILNFVCIPGLVFHQIGIQPFNLKIFLPIIIGLLTQATVQILILIISFIFPFESKKSKYINLIYSCSYYDCLFASLPISQFIFGDKYNYIPVMLSMVQYLIIIPLHKVITFKMLGPPTTSIDEEAFDKTENEGEMALENIDDNGKASIEEIPTKDVKVSGEANPKELMKKKPETKRLNDENGDDKNDTTSFLEESKKPSEETAKPPEETASNNSDEEKVQQSNLNVSQNSEENCVKRKFPGFYRFTQKLRAKTVCNTLLWSIVTPINICFLLGVVWMAIGIKMPKFLSQFSTDLEKAVVAAGLFASGVFMWKQPFFGCSPIEVPLAALSHFVLLPSIAALFCWFLKVDNLVSQIIVFSFAAPSALSSFAEAVYNNLQKSTITYTFFWTYLLCLPVFILWTVVFNQTKLFNVS